MSTAGGRYPRQLRGFFAVREVVLRPSVFFRSMRAAPPPSLWKALIFALSCYLVSILLSSVVAPVGPLARGSPNPLLRLLTEGPATLSSRELLGIVLLPLWGVIGLFMVAALQHLFVWQFFYENRGFKATFAAVSYSSAALLFSWVPVVGLVAVVYEFYLTLVGVRELHSASGRRAFVVVLVPYVIVLVPWAAFQLLRFLNG